MLARAHVSLAKAFQKFRDCDSDFKKYKRTKNGRSLGWGRTSEAGPPTTKKISATPENIEAHGAHPPNFGDAIT
jgi:hypothetical protein